MLRSRTRTLTIAAVALVAVALAVAPAGAGQSFETDLRMSKKFPAFHGKVKSEEPFCKGFRKVKLYRKLPGEERKKLGTDVSAENGEWKVKVKNLSSGAYHAKTPSLDSAALGIKCKADRSRTVVVD
jgi:hypothetical protein